MFFTNNLQILPSLQYFITSIILIMNNLTLYLIIGNMFFRMFKYQYLHLQPHLHFKTISLPPLTKSFIASFKSDEYK